MGLFDSFSLDNLDDPRKQALLAMGLGLLAPKQAKTNFAGDLGQAGLLGLQSYVGAKNNQQEMQMRDLQAQQMKNALDQQRQAQALGQRAFAPAMQPLTPNDDNGNPMPSAPAGGGMSEFLRGMMGIDPMKAAQLQSLMVRELPYGKVDPKDYTPESLKKFAASGNMDFTVLEPRVKKDFVNGVAVDPYATPSGSYVSSPQSDVIPDGKGGFMYNPAKINPLDKARLGLEGQRVGIEGQRLGLDKLNAAYNTGFDFQTGQFNPVSPKINQETQGAVNKEAALFKQTSLQGLSDLEAQTNHTIQLGDALIKHPGFSTTVGTKGLTGAFAAAGHPIPGTDAADFEARRKQLAGTQFLQAYATLKGAGQISNFEGDKAQRAIARMDNAQSEKEFKAAWDDYRSVLQLGLDRMRKKAGVTTNGGFSIRKID